MLMPKMKNTSAMMNTAQLTNYNADPEILHFRMLIGDDAWVHYHDAESKYVGLNPRKGIMLILLEEIVQDHP